MRRRTKVALAILAPVVAGAAYAASISSFGTPLAPGAELSPDLVAPDAEGTPLRLGDLRGSIAVVFFYPKDETPGCTKEACAFRDGWSDFEAGGVRVVGVSGGSVSDKARYRGEERVALPDPGRRGPRVGARLRRSRGLRHPSRVTFLLDRDGRVAKVYPDVDPGVHAAEVLADARSL